MGKRLSENEALGDMDETVQGALDVKIDESMFWGTDVFPPVPDKPGFHRCWVRVPQPNDSSSVNNYVMHLRWGYRLVPLAEMSGFDGHSLNTINGQSFVSVRDCGLMEVPVEVYRKIRKFFDDKTEAADRTISEVPDNMRADPAAQAFVSRNKGLNHINRNRRGIRTPEEEYT